MHSQTHSWSQTFHGTSPIHSFPLLHLHSCTLIIDSRVCEVHVDHRLILPWSLKQDYPAFSMHAGGSYIPVSLQRTPIYLLLPPSTEASLYKVTQVSLCQIQRKWVRYITWPLINIWPWPSLKTFCSLGCCESSVTGYDSLSLFEYGKLTILGFSVYHVLLERDEMCMLFLTSWGGWKCRHPCPSTEKQTIPLLVLAQNLMDHEEWEESRFGDCWGYKEDVEWGSPGTGSRVRKQ